MRKLYLLFVVALALSLSSVAFADEGDMVTIDLNDQNDSGVTGTATLTDNGDDTTTVEIELEGSPEGGSHPAHFHDGTSCDQNEPIVHPLENVEDGMSTSTVEESLDDLVGDNYYLNIHLSEEEIATVVACGDEYVEMAGTPDTGGGAMSGSTGLPVAGLGLFGAVLAAGALLLVRSRAV